MTSDVLVFVMLGLVSLVVSIYVGRELYLEFGHTDPPPQIDRFGYVLGQPKSVQCSACGSKCRPGATFKREGEIWTEWQCPRCIK